ncbi:hypothetical protein [Bradyrhizobium cenepequi]|uniref:hypothetical protein n=1 Tax=Bradyrhizobium cenepequi TaxID=2821403 RepID=UPI001CE366C6|nr:hypothetical protein [Bradyrhizobium cenepequi]MCA6110193.1 hypothetical protein [Bradyrhizobium cenepequi]
MARQNPKIPFFCPAVDMRRGLISPSGAGKWGDCQMITKASGLLAVLVAAGLFAGVAAPSPVEAAGSGGTTASDTDNATSVKKQSTRHGKRNKSAKTESKSRESKSTESKSTESKSTESKSSETKKPDGAEVVDAAAVSTALPVSVANAKAELTPNVPADNASAMSAKVNTLLAASDKPDEVKAPGDDDVVASDQLNEVDRALQESQQQNQPAAQPQQPAPAAAMTTAQAPAAPVASSDDSTWDRTSLIGKIFIAAGALLTMASAARMFMA